MAMKPPRFEPGERVTLADDKRQWPWVVLFEQPGGAYRIGRAGLPPSPYTEMNALPTKLIRATD